MTLVTGIATYIVIWWIVLFAVLPWGVKPPEELVPGQADSAPENPRLLMKAGVTTLIAGVIWLGIFLLVSSDWISFREMAE
jgi:predicted secreted protein